jgi:hypothetical protein
MVNLFSFETSILNGCRNSTTLDALLYVLTHYHNISELLGQTTHYGALSVSANKVPIYLSRSWGCT